MIRRLRSFLAFWVDLVIGDDRWVAVGVVVALAVTCGLSTRGVPSWWVLPAAVLILLPLSLWRAGRAS